MAISGVITQLRTTNLERSIEFYVDTIGLELEFRYSDFFAGIKAGDQSFFLKLVDDPDPSIPFVLDGEHMHLFFPTDDADAAAELLRSRGVTFVKDVANTPYLTREFYVQDDQGHVLCIAEAREETISGQQTGGEE
jgi:catechol 2,3-dioxygenase-like lactoylglutathione lyase family enzyme